MRRTFFAIVVFTMTAANAFALSPNEETEVKQMHWLPAANLHLASSNSAILDLKGFSTVQGAEARRFRQIVDGTGHQKH